MKPIIGVMPLWDDKKESIWMLPGYLDGLIQAGGLPIIIPLISSAIDLEKIAGICDGFLFTGGHDVSPEMYSEKSISGLTISCKARDEMESVILRKAIETNKPVLGICRGIQFINVSLGGTLYQDLPLQKPTGITHQQKPPYTVPVHIVNILESSPLYKCLMTKELKVNSYHHQAIKSLSPDLEAMAFSPDGIVEALFMPSHRFLWAVQWHPEFLYQSDSNSRKLFKAFVDAVKS